MTASLADVARRAGVSVSTASRVLSDSTYHVTPEMKARVRQAAEEIGYTPNALARALVTRRSRLLGVVVGVNTDPYFAEITRGVEDHARRAGYLTIVCNTDRNPTIELAYLRLLRNHHAEGLIITGGAFAGSDEADRVAHEIRLAKDEGVNVVSLADRGLADIPFIGVDDARMMYDLANFLISLGHQRLAVVAGPLGYTTSDLRVDGFVAAVREAGLEPEVYTGGLSFESGERAVLQFLRDLPDAVIGLTDEAALGIITALRDAGVHVPGRVSVAGVNDTRSARMFGLTTASLPIYELGAAAAKRVIGPDEGDQPQRTVMPHRITSRTTTSRRNARTGRTGSTGVQPGSDG